LKEHEQQKNSAFCQDVTTKHTLIAVLSVSGGCDSVAMLHACMELQNTLSETDTTILMECHVVHFNHRQRDQDADLDCQLVQDIAQDYGIPFVLKDWKTDSSFSSESFSQDMARNWRRQRLVEYTQSLVSASCDDDAAATKSTGVILTAHHKDDSTETMLLKLLRGVHILNLSGMGTITSIDQAKQESMYMVRPWLQYTKQELKDYLLARGKTWRDDASNASPKYLRNRVRNELLPLLEELSPNIHKRLDLLEHQSRELQQEIQSRVQVYLQDVVDGDFFEWKHADASRLIQSQALYQWMNQEIKRMRQDQSIDSNGADFISYDTLQRVVQQLQDHPAQLEWTLELGGLFNLRRHGSMLQVIYTQQATSSKNMIPWIWSIVGNDLGEEDDDRDSLTIAVPQELVSSHLHVAGTTVGQFSLLQSDQNAGALRFLPPWKKAGKPVKLRQFLRGQDIPMHERDQISILCITCHNENKDSYRLVAVQIRDSWIVHGDYNPSSAGDKTDIILLLRVESLS
jgi:tRNA(Ile)-lysidine synthetase-like protein